ATGAGRFTNAIGAERPAAAPGGASSAPPPQAGGEQRQPRRAAEREAGSLDPGGQMGELEHGGLSRRHPHLEQPEAIAARGKRLTSDPTLPERGIRHARRQPALAVRRNRELPALATRGGGERPGLARREHEEGAD